MYYIQGGKKLVFVSENLQNGEKVVNFEIRL